MNPSPGRPEMAIRTDALVREEVFTDLRTGTIKRLVPVRTDGTQDETRTVRFVGQTQVMTPAGALPLDFEIEASGLEEAVRSFPNSVQAALERLAEDMEKLQRERASQIVTPGAGAGPNLIVPS